MTNAGATSAQAAPTAGETAAAAQRVAQRFVTATGTTDTDEPEGDVAEWGALAPSLAVPRGLGWPEAWIAEDRTTTVVLDPPSPVVAVGARQVAVIVTGQSVVATDVGPPEIVPIAERLTLRLVGANSTASQRRTASRTSAVHWVVTDVATGS